MGNLLAGLVDEWVAGWLTAWDFGCVAGWLADKVGVWLCRWLAGFTVPAARL